MHHIDTLHTELYVKLCLFALHSLSQHDERGEAAPWPPRLTPPTAGCVRPCVVPGGPSHSCSRIFHPQGRSPTMFPCADQERGLDHTHSSRHPWK